MTLAGRGREGSTTSFLATAFGIMGGWCILPLLGRCPRRVEDLVLLEDRDWRSQAVTREGLGNRWQGTGQPQEILDPMRSHT